jgi:uncharacterized protein RhaS with RHS repeats
MSYDPTIGRWTVEDPIDFAGGDANLYRYVGNVPTNYVDPTGLEAGVLRPGNPGAPTIGEILGDSTIREQLAWFRRRHGANPQHREEGGWVLYNTCNRKFTLTVDGVEQNNENSTKRKHLPSLITPNYPTRTPKDPSDGPPPGFPVVGPPEPAGGCWVVVAAWHTHPARRKNPSDPVDYGPIRIHGIHVIVQWGINPGDMTSASPP